MDNQNALIESEEQDLIFYPTRLKMLLGFTGSLAFVVAGFWITLP